MKARGYNVAFIYRLAGWANILAWVSLLLGIVGGLIYVYVAWNTWQHPEAFQADLFPLPGQLGYTNAIMQQIIRCFQAVVSGFVSFVFLKAVPEGLFLLVDFADNTRPPHPAGDIDVAPPAAE